jgi:hypothetical protein
MESEGEENLVFQRSRRDSRVADGAQEKGVVIRQFAEASVGKAAAMFKIEVGAEGVFGPGETEAETVGGGVEGFPGFGSDFGADAVSGDDGESIGFHGGSFGGCKKERRPQGVPRLFRTIREN